MIDVRALTLKQPYASLVALGVKTIIDQAKPTGYRGRLLIHAGKARPDFSPLRIREACYAHAVGVWEQRPNEPGGVLICVDQSTIDFGAVVASAQLVDVVPIVDSPSAHNCVDVRVGHPEAGLALRADLGDEGDYTGERVTDITDQRPFGDFAAGRWALILDDVQATTERCPRCWGDRDLANRVTPTADPNVVRSTLKAHRWCPTCEGRGVCPPVSMKGKAGLWTPTWEGASSDQRETR